MKTFRMIGMAVVALVLSMSLVSCDDDDDDDYYNTPDPAFVTNTVWEIVGYTDPSLNYGNGAYIIFYDDGSGVIVDGGARTDFDFEEYSSLSISLYFHDAERDTMCGAWQYTDDDYTQVDFKYYWQNVPDDEYFHLYLTYKGKAE